MVAEETSSENAFETTLTAEMGPTDLAAAVVTKGSLTTPSILTIEPDDDAQREIIRFNGTFGASSFVTQNVSFRYLPGSAAGSGLTHPSGAIVRSTPTVQHLEDINDRVDALDHGDDLAGLGDDDHTQYHNNARGDARYVELAGDTMTGLLVLSGDPAAALEAATKQYVDELFGPWTPSYTDLTIGSGVVVSRFMRRPGSGLLVATYELKFAGDTTIDGANPTISLPVNAAATYTFPRHVVGPAAAFDDDAGATFTGQVRLESASTFSVAVHNSASTFLSHRNLDATVPMTWAVDDVLSFTAVYEPV